MPKNKAVNRYALSLASLALGAGLTLGYAPFSQWYLVPLLLLGFFALLSGPGRAFPFLTGLSFGLGWFGAGVSWVHVSIADFGGLPLLGSLSLMLLLCLYLALYPALASWLLVRFIKLPYWPMAIPLIWYVTEWLRGWMLTGFPWLSLGYSQLHGPLGGWLPIVGETGVSLLLVLMASGVMLLLRQRHWLSAALLVVVPMISGVVLDGHSWTKATGKHADVVMVQGNIKQELRWVPEQDGPTMRKYLEMTAPYWDADLIIWPEAAIPRLEPLVPEYLGELDEIAAENGTGLITGIVNYNFETRQAFNQLIGVGSLHGEKQGHYRYMHTNRYAKHHLLPIGEFIPLEDWLRGLAPIFDLPMSSFSRGNFEQNNLIANDYRLAPAICFEIAFPEQMRANLHPYTDFILTVSNDAWFGRSHGPHQHLEIAQVRAKEFGIPVLRATNNGITAVIDANGQIIAKVPQFEDAVLRAEVPTYRGDTPFGAYGDLWIVLLSLAGFGLALWLPRTDWI
ncbi:apolipoprotein N-acyltransferase [Aliiglaciecola sp. CAU 1673]|uniref:apolipoprotein N-acyltransferase n=1 Tax=Aliiglaciecola sp. CAU 1673 TaxID=3032595 RepID=UPI0023DA127E|nr:apolipoprotein N-acyltransferase [Aliiglaciecola sp. CAU 1673]MDF2179360.1 apolipoprotein N-acyltransferase [Aliiglaciecola sp. CAU 1673]